jgi:hypothetical protein
MSLEKVKHRTSKPAKKRDRKPTQRQSGKGGWPDYDERENVFYTPTQTTYAKVLTIRNTTAARESVKWMKEEYRRASGSVPSVKKDGKTVQVKPSKAWVNHIHKAMDNTAKRAEISKKRKNLSSKEQKEMGAVANVYKKALAGKDFGNYYSGKRMGANRVPSGLSKQPLWAKGEVGANKMSFRIVTQTSKGNTVMRFKPFKKVYSSGNRAKVIAKKNEMQSAGYAVRVVREGRTRHVYVQSTQTLKAIQAVARARSKKAKKRRYEREKKRKQRAKPKSKGKKSKKKT